MKKILILGTGGHAKSCIDLISRCKDYNLIGLISKNSDEIGKKILDVKVVGSDQELINYVKNNRSIIGTMDKGLKNKIKKLGSSILSIHNDKIVLES